MTMTPDNTLFDPALLNHLEWRCVLVAEAVYSASDLPRDGLRLATERQKAGILREPENVLTDLSDAMREQFYYDERSGQFLLAFAGTEAFNLNHWRQNVKQYIGLPPEYYRQAVDLVRAIKPEYRDNVILTGHSLGGGVATVAAIAGEMKAFVFNPPSLHQNTLAEFDGFNVALAKTNVRRFIVAGELLDIVNHTLGIAQHRIGGKTQLYGSFTIPLSSVLGLSALLKKLIPGVGIALSVLAPLAEKSLRLHLMPEVLYGLKKYLEN